MNAKKIWPLILIMLIAVFFRFWDIREMPPGLYPDEAMNGNNTLEANYTGDYKVFYPENNGREGLFINIQAVSVSVFGNKPWALRLVSGIFGTLTVLGLYFLTRELFKLKNFKSEIRISKSETNPKSQIQNPKQTNSGFSHLNLGNWNLFGNWKLKIKNALFLNNLSSSEIIALISSFFLAVSFWHINFSRIGFRAIMAPFFLTWSLFLLLKALNNFKNSKQKQNFENLEIENSMKIENWKLKIILALSGLVFGLGFHSYIAYRATPLLPFLVFLFYFIAKRGERKKVFFSALIFSAGFILAILPLLFYFLNNPQDFFGRTAQVSVFASDSPVKNLAENLLKTLGMFWYQGDFNWRHNFAGEPALRRPIGMLFAVGILICIYRIINFQFSIFNFQLNPNFKNSKQKQNFENLEIENSMKIENWKLKIEKYILPELLLLLWFIVGLLPVIISNEGLPHALRAIIMIPPVMVISAIGLEFLIRKISNWLDGAEIKYSEIARKIARIKKELRIVVYLFLISAGVYAYILYFMKYAVRPEVYDAFAGNYVKIGEYLNALPDEMEKYIIVNANGADVRGYPMPTQTTMFISKTYLPEWKSQKNTKYLLPDKINEISCFSSCAIITLENDPLLRQKLKQQIPDLNSESGDGFIVLRK